MNAAEKFQDLLRELFQFDCADLDFGIYRVMNHKRDAVERFVSSGLPRAVSDELGKDALREQADAQAALDAARDVVVKTLGASAIDADGNLDDAYRQTPLGERYAGAKARAQYARSREALETSVYNHLYAFFRRYYQDGDFISKRRYSRANRYAVPYNGEEVYLHWANSDQYYVKTDEHFRNYDWSAPAGGDGDDVSVRFRVRAANVENGNVKGERRFFIPRAEDAEWDDDARAATIPFEYRPLSAAEKRRYGTRNQQDKITAAAVREIPKRLRAASAPDDALKALQDEHRLNGNGDAVSRLEHHLKRYARKNESDFFIHKDLSGFLNRELDFYIKNEVLNLDDLNNAGESAGAGWFQIMRLIKAVGGDVIDFLAQIEGFQKTLWEKRKFVTDVQYCVTVGAIDDRFHAEIIANDAQWAEWRDLFGVSDADRKPAFLKANPTLVVDTARFDADFADRLLASFDNLDGMTDGVLVHGENWQALRLMEEVYKGRVKCVYIDPPYNSGQENDFLYKDSYQHSSWMTMMFNVLGASRVLAAPLSGIFVSTDDEEYANLKFVMDRTWGADNFVADVIWNSRKSVSSDTLISVAANHTTFFAADKAALNSRKASFRLPQLDDKFSNPDNDPLGPWTLDPMDAPNVRENLTYEIENPSTGKKFLPPPGRCWRFEQWKTEELLASGRIQFGRDGKSRPQYKRYLSEAQARGKAPTTLWDDVKTTTDATRLLLNLFGETLPRSEINRIKPKPTELVERCVRLLTDWSGIALDYFAGSGTTAHAVINLNREDGGSRKFVLVEMGEYFDTVLLPRVKKVIFSPEWKGGLPARPSTPEEAERAPKIVKYLRIESYEDALDGIEFDDAMGEMRLDERLGDEYTIKYMLKWETKGSRTLLNLSDLTRPFDYRLRSHANGEKREATVDLAETFNWLIGLKVKTRRTHRYGNRRYLVYRGETRDAPGRETVVIWRDTEGWTERQFMADSILVLECGMADGADTLYMNGGSVLEGSRSVETLFDRRMFAGAGGERRLDGSVR